MADPGADEDTPILQVEGLTRTFGSLVAVDDVDLTVPHGEIHAIIGPNGAGKTTLFDMIAGTLSPSAGRVLFEGTDITGLPEHVRARRGICRAYQITELFPGLSIRENLRLAAQATGQDLNPLHDRDEGHRRAAIEMIGRLDIDAAPTATASTLSHGDKKKLEIGMALLTDPDLLLLDEPTSGVSQAESGQVVEFVDDLRNDLTVLLIEHDIDLVLDLSDRITVLNRGAVIAAGTPDQITDDEAVQEAYLGGGG